MVKPTTVKVIVRDGVKDVDLTPYPNVQAMWTEEPGVPAKPSILVDVPAEDNEGGEFKSLAPPVEFFKKCHALTRFLRSELSALCPMEIPSPEELFELLDKWTVHARQAYKIDLVKGGVKLPRNLVDLALKEADESRALPLPWTQRPECIKNCRVRCICSRHPTALGAPGEAGRRLAKCDSRARPLECTGGLRCGTLHHRQFNL